MKFFAKAALLLVFLFGLFAWAFLALAVLPDHEKNHGPGQIGPDDQVIKQRLDNWEQQMASLSAQIQQAQLSLSQLHLDQQQQALLQEQVARLQQERNIATDNLRGANAQHQAQQELAQQKQQNNLLQHQLIEQPNPVAQPLVQKNRQEQQTIQKPAEQAGRPAAAPADQGGGGAAPAQRELDWGGATFAKQGWRGRRIQRPVPLVVSGTDGSGTRSVVDLLVRLGVNMVIDDRGTNDVEGYELGKGGWPPPVRLVLDDVHTIDYEVKALSQSVQSNVGNAVKSFVKAMRGKASRKKGNFQAKHTEWGFKAPVSMCLVPFLQAEVGAMKLLHVVRDGRDIAFSGNQSPVNKFFGNQYPAGSPHHRLGPEAKAVRLWSDWNVQLLDWGTKHGDGERFDYMAVRTDDLIRAEARFAAIRQIRDFVGSTKSDQEICCIAMESNKDLGSHSYGKKEKQVTQRYGKWHAKVEGKPQLKTDLHREGARGLEVFGYEPHRPGDEIPCECSKSAPSKKAHCSMSQNTDYKGADIEFQSAASDGECCDICGAHSQCTHFTFVPKDNICFLKSGSGTISNGQGMVSGTVVS